MEKLSEETIAAQLGRFVKQKAVEWIDFPSDLSGEDRKKVHKVAESMLLDHFSYGAGKNRVLRVKKRNTPTTTPTATGNTDTLHKRVYTLEDLSMGLVLRCRNDFKLPLTAFTGPEFLYQIELYEPVYKTKSIFKEFVEHVNTYQATHSDGYLDYVDGVKEKLMKCLTTTEAYALFKNESMDKYKIPGRADLPSHLPIYQPENDGRYFISADISSADFSALSFHNAMLVLGCKSWEELLLKFSEDEHLRRSRKFRQFILGEINTPKTKKIMEWLIYMLYKKLVTEKIFKKVDFVALLSDELVVAVKKEKLKESYLVMKEAIGRLPARFPKYKVDGFRIVRLGETAYYVKESLKDVEKEDFSVESAKIAVTFKSTPPHLLPQCFKYYFKMPLEENDLKMWDSHNNKYQVMTNKIFN